MSFLLVNVKHDIQQFGVVNKITLNKICKKIPEDDNPINNEEYVRELQ